MERRRFNNQKRSIELRRPERSNMTSQIKEHTCMACDGTGFPPVKQPALATHRIYPVKCESCGGKGRVANAAN
jgi:DnaJ-class molecular chaperone